MLVWMIWISEPFVTKPSMVVHHYKPECRVWKLGCYLQGQGHSSWVWVHTMKSWLFLLYVLNCWLSCENVAFGSRSQCRFWTSVNVCPDNISDWWNLVLWCIIISQSVIQKYHFGMFKVKATIVCIIISQCHSEISFWYVQGQSHNCFY